MKELTVDIFMPFDEEYIIEQMIPIYERDKKIVSCEKSVAIIAANDIVGRRLYTIEFSATNHILEFGFDLGKCSVAAEYLNKFQ